MAFGQRPHTNSRRFALFLFSISTAVAIVILEPQQMKCERENTRICILKYIYKLDTNKDINGSN